MAVSPYLEPYLRPPRPHSRPFSLRHLNSAPAYDALADPHLPFYFKASRLQLLIQRGLLTPNFKWPDSRASTPTASIGLARKVVAECPAEKECMFEAFRGLQMFRASKATRSDKKRRQRWLKKVYPGLKLESKLKEFSSKRTKSTEAEPAFLTQSHEEFMSSVRSKLEGGNKFKRIMEGIHEAELEED